MWCFKKRGKQAIGRSRGGLTTKINTITASDKFAVNFSLSSGSANDSPEGIKLLNLTQGKGTQIILMDRAYAGKNIREVAVKVGYKPVVPPKKNFKKQWEYDKELYKKRNAVERFFRRIKRFRRIFKRYDKLDVVYEGFILFAMVIDSLV